MYRVAAAAAIVHEGFPRSAPLVALEVPLQALPRRRHRGRGPPVGRPRMERKGKGGVSRATYHEDSIV